MLGAGSNTVAFAKKQASQTPSNISFKALLKEMSAKYDANYDY